MMRTISFGSEAPLSLDIWVLLAVVFATFSMQFFDATAQLLYWLRLTPGVVEHGQLWQLITYPFIGFGSPDLWFLFNLLILFWFSRDVFWALGRRRFWRLLSSAALVAGAVAVLGYLVGLGSNPHLPPLLPPFLILQGQHTLLVILIAAFATLHQHATIYLFFVLPVKARWFLWLEILFAFLAFLSSKDFAGFLGVCAAVGFTYASLQPGGPLQELKRGWLRLKYRVYQGKLRSLQDRRHSGSTGPRRWPGGGDDDNLRQGPWVN